MKLTSRIGRSLLPEKPPPPASRTETFWSQKATLVEIIPSTPEAPARPKWPFDAVGEIGFVCAPGIATYYEGATERLAIIAEWATRRPSYVKAQPETAIILIGGKKYKHFPDFLLKDAWGERRMEAKSQTAMNDPVEVARFRAIADCYEAAGYRYELAPATALYEGAFADGVKWVFRNRLRSVSDERRRSILNCLPSGKAISGGELATRLGLEFDDHLRRDLCALHAQGYCAIDLYAGAPSATTALRKGPSSVAPPWLSAGEF